MKKISSLIVAVFLIATNTLIAQHAVGEVPSLPFGNMAKVEQYAVSNVYVIGIWTYYFNTNGSWKGYMTSGMYPSTPMTNKVQMDQIIATQLSNILSNLLANANPIINKDMGIKVYVQCRMAANWQLAQASFATPYIYITPNKVGGVYSVPDLSWFKTTMASDLPMYIPGTSWVRMEIGYWGDPFPFEVDDRRLDPSTDILHSDGFIYLPVDVITDSSIATGTYQLKVSIFSSAGFQSFNGDGKLLPETPMRTGIASSGSSVTVTVRGGDSGRAYFLQKSQNLKSWTNVGEVNIVSPLSHYFPSGASRSFVIGKTNQMFFRTVTTNVSPY
ncbi:MAG: hypothetical protein WCW03_00350 [Candidatus Paceibacterota bacterium]|jgi:hypothetical protein